MKKKVEIVVDAAALDAVVAIVESAGAKGYTIVPKASGKGHRGVRAAHDVFEDEAKNALVIVVAPEDVARRILTESLRLLESYAGIAYLTDVEVARGDYF